MTTMDSDSASQDSDDGRRFRFEATRKDSHLGDNSRKGRMSPARVRSSRRSRSRDRGNRDRRDNDRARASHDHRRESSRSDGKTSTGSRSQNFTNQRDSRDSRGSPLHSSRRQTKNHEEKRFHDRSNDEKSSTTDRNSKSRDRRRYSTDRNRERSAIKTKNVDLLRLSREDNPRWESSRGSGRKNDEKTALENISDGKNLENSRSASPKSTRQDCRDLNLSDFDIVSDTEEASSDNSPSRRNVSKTNPIDSDASTKKRVSKHHYERMLKRQAVRKRRNSEELQKVKPRNGDDEKVDGDNNRRDLSDFSLGNPAEMASGPSSSLRNNAEPIPIEECINDIVNDDFDDIAESSRDFGSSSSMEKNNDGHKKIDVEKRIMGPNLPIIYRKYDDSGNEDTFGPALPPHLTKNPVESKTETIIDTNYDNEVDGKSESDDEDIMGPLPVDHPALENDIIQQQLERRARRLKAELAACDNEDEKKREEWMIELPPAKSVSLGLGPRKFRVRPAPDMSDRSSWTDTPADRARKRIEKLENNSVSEPTISAEKGAIDDAGGEIEKSRKREKSLLEIHQKKLNKKKKKEEKEARKIGKPVERRPFDRDVDLQANRFDEARKKSMFLKARELDDRFSRGKI